MLGLALLCPVAERSRNLPDHHVVRQDAEAYDELEPDQRVGFEEYFVVCTPATARRYRDHVLPGTRLVDETALERIFAGWTVDVGSGTFAAPTLIAAGRRDSVVGYTDAVALLEHYPHATLAVIEDAGHALIHERPELLAAFLGDWLKRASPRRLVIVALRLMPCTKLAPCRREVGRVCRKDDVASDVGHCLGGVPCVDRGA